MFQHIERMKGVTGNRKEMVMKVCTGLVWLIQIWKRVLQT